MADNSTDGNSDNAEGSSSTQTDWKIANKDVLRPVTLQQVLRASRQENSRTSPFSIDGRKFQTIRVVATVRTETINRLNAFFKLDDGTISTNYPVLATYFFPPDIGDFEPILPSSKGIVSALSVLRDVCVIGRIDNDPKTASGRNFIRIDAIRPVTDPHETYYHVLDVIQTELMYERGLPPCYVRKASAPRTESADTPEENSDGGGKGKEPEASTEDDEHGVPMDELKNHPTNTPAPKRARPSSSKVPQEPPPNFSPDTPAPQTPTKSSTDSRDRRSPTTPSGAMDSLALNSPQADGSDTGSTPQTKASTKASTKKGKGKSVAINSEPESPTPSGAGRRRTTTTGSRTRSSRKISKSTSQNPGSSTPADPAPGPSKRRPRLSMRDPLSHLSLIERSILLKIKEDAPAGSSNGVHVEDIVTYVIASHSQEGINEKNIIDALDSLYNAEHIEAVDEGLTIYRAKDVKGRGRAYDIPLGAE